MQNYQFLMFSRVEMACLISALYADQTVLAFPYNLIKKGAKKKKHVLVLVLTRIIFLVFSHRLGEATSLFLIFWLSSSHLSVII